MTLISYNRNKGLPSLADALFDSWGFFPEFLTTSHKNKGFPSFISTAHMNKGIPVNTKETDESFEMELVAPGLKKEDFNINLEDNVLTVSSETKTSKDEGDDGYTRREFSYNSFSRSFTLPDNSDGEKISAKYEDGILKLEIPKKEIAKKSPKMIEVL